jgi:ATP adenylyltransferase
MKDRSLPTARFSNLLSEQNCPKPSYDRVLQRYDGCVVVPTLGSILPNWLLIVPEKPVINFREWEKGSYLSADGLVRKFLRSRGIAAPSAIWFEHGPTKVGTSVGCGVDHAHIHVLVDAPFELEDFVFAAKTESGSEFKSVPTNAIFQGTRKDESYLLIASGDHAMVAKNVDQVGSQFLRRVVAHLAGQPDAWNYRTHPWLNNVEKTLQAFAPV